MAEVILNSRLLTHNSDSLLDEQPLTPTHLLHLLLCPVLPPGVFDKDDLSCRGAWRQAQYLANLFWCRWTSEYLPTLLERKKWNTPRRNLAISYVILASNTDLIKAAGVLPCSISDHDSVYLEFDLKKDRPAPVYITT